MGANLKFCFWTVLLLGSLAAASDYCIPSCDKADKDGYKVQDPTSCVHYYFCSAPNNETAYQLSDETIKCDEGLYFNQNPGSGDPGCFTPYICDVCNPCVVKCTAKGLLLPDPYDCNGFYYCDEVDQKNPTHFTCSSGEIFDYRTQACGPVGNTTQCFDFCDPCRVYCVEEGRMTNPSDCRSYLYCEPGNGVATFHCDPNEVFNPVSLLCEDDQGQDCTPVCEPEAAEPTSTSPPV